MLSPIGTLRMAVPYHLSLSSGLPVTSPGRSTPVGSRKSILSIHFCSAVCPSRWSAIVIVPTFEECARISRADQSSTSWPCASEIVREGALSKVLV